jgi:hypothetical protein
MIEDLAMLTQKLHWLVEYIRQVSGLFAQAG